MIKKLIMCKLVSKYFFLSFFSLVIAAVIAFAGDNYSLKLYTPDFFYDTAKLTKNDILFDSLRLGRLGLGRRAYDYAMLGYNVLKANHIQ